MHSNSSARGPTGSRTNAWTQANSASFDFTSIFADDLNIASRRGQRVAVMLGGGKEFLDCLLTELDKEEVKADVKNASLFSDNESSCG